MKKKYIIIIINLSLLVACNNNAQNKILTTSSSTETSTEGIKKKLTKRNYAITKGNAFNDLTLDSNEVVGFINQRKIPDTLSRRIISFYNARNYHYAWFSSKGVTEQALGFWNLHNYEQLAGDTISTDKVLHKKMDAIVASDSNSVNTRDKSIQVTELLLTEHFIAYALNNYHNGFLKRKEMERFIPFEKANAVVLADSLINKKHKDNKYFDEVNNQYKLLKTELVKYVDISKKGGWPILNVNSKLYKKGTSSPAIGMLKKRLQITGDLPESDSTFIYDDALSNAIMIKQEMFGYTPTGKVNSSLLKDLNVPVNKRIEQILINLNRMRWMPQEPSGKLILVNIPEFVLHFVDGKNKVFDMNVVVGKEGHNTMMFTGNLSTIVFSPYWNVPPSIVKKEIMPKMAANPNYLENQDLEIVRMEGGLPVIRQKPGEKNSLGKVKFLFPNSFNIYFHDTDAKRLFDRDKRAYSHGCIRLAEPEKMADYLLQDNDSWPPDKINDAMNSGKEQFVKIKHPVPVFITYYTSWVSENGKLNFRDDIYGRDSVVAKKMFY